MFTNKKGIFRTFGTLYGILYCMYIQKVTFKHLSNYGQRSAFGKVQGPGAQGGGDRSQVGGRGGTNLTCQGGTAKLPGVGGSPAKSGFFFPKNGYFLGGGEEIRKHHFS